MIYTSFMSQQSTAENMVVDQQDLLYSSLLEQSNV
jgi:hypothetical protein